MWTRHCAVLLSIGGLSQALAASPAVGQPTTATAQDDALPFQYELSLSTGARWQIDNGTRTGPEDGLDWDPTGENFGEINNTIAGSISYEEFQLSLQFDTATYIHRPRAAADATQTVRTALESRYEDVYRLEFLSLSYSDRNLDVTLGDFYVTLGRGMLLSIRKVGDVGVDNKLRGMEARARLGPVTVHGFAGLLNIRNYEVGQGFFYPESVPEANCSDAADALALCANGMDLIGGGRLEYRLGKYLKAGVHAAAIDVPDALDDVPEGQPLGDTDVRGIGATIELPRPVKWLNAFFEGVVLERSRPNIGRDETEPGKGLYGNINMFLGKTTILAEGKAYDNLFNVSPRGYSTSQSVTANRQVINRILEPPTAERPLTRILANNTAYGGHLRVDHRFTPRLVPFLAGGYFRDESFNVPTNIIFGYGGVQMRWKGGEARINAGYRAQLNDRDTDAAAATVQLAEQAVRDAPDDAARQAAEAELASAQNILRQERVRDGSAFRNDAHLYFDVSVDVGGPYSLEFFGDTFYVIFEGGLIDCASPDEMGNPACDGVDPESTQFALDPEEWVEGRLSLSLRSRAGWSLTGAYEFYTRQPGVIAEHYPSLSGQWDFTEGGTLRFLVGGERAGLKCSGGVCRFFPGFEGARLEMVFRI